MKILLVQLIGKGGIQLYTSQLANALSKSDNEVVVLLGDYLFDEHHYSNSKAKIICIDTQPSYFRMILKIINPFTYYHILKIIEHEKPDVIHILFEDILFSIVSLFLKIKRHTLVLTVHNPTPHLGDNFIVKFNSQLSRFIMRRLISAVIVHGSKLQNILVEDGFAKNDVFVIPIGNFSYFTKWEKDTYSVGKTILFFGLIREYKGLEYLIKAEPIITSSIPDLRIIIAGAGNFEKYEDMIKNKACFDIHNRFIPDEEVAYFFQKSDVIVLPYTDGSQSGIIPIAYAFKKPVVVTDVGSIAEVVEDGVTGFIVPPKDTAALADAIIKILKDDDLRKRMSENVCRKMKNDLSWDKIADKTIEVYKNVIREHK